MMKHPTVRVTEESDEVLVAEDSDNGSDETGTGAFLIFGPVGSGKTTALEVVDERIERMSVDNSPAKAGYDAIDMGDQARRLYAETDTDMSVSEWAGWRKTVDGDAWLAEAILDDFAGYHHNYDVTPVVSGIRSPKEVDVFESEYGDVTVVWVWADVFSRYNRVAQRKERDTMTPEEFFERDHREWNWGMDELSEPSNYDVWIPNMASVSEFKSCVRDIVFDEIHRWDIPDDDLLAPWHGAVEQEVEVGIPADSSGGKFHYP